MRVVRLQFQDIRELLTFYHSFTPSGGFFWATRQEVLDREQVLLEIQLSECELKWSFECVVLGSLRDLGLEVEPGYLLGFNASEAAKRDQMLEEIGWQIIGSNRRLHARIPRTMAVAWRTTEGEDLQVGHTENVGLGGAFIRSDILAPQGSMLTIHLRCGERWPAITVKGRVAWTRSHGLGTGMGVQFLNLEPDQGLQLQRVLAAMEE